MAYKPPQTSIFDLFNVATTEIDKSIHLPNALHYVPYPEQEAFHRSTKPGRYLAGGNRGGKTDAEVVEAIWWATDTHPFQERPPEWGKGPMQLRMVAVDVTKGIEGILLPKLKRWIPASALRGGTWHRAWDNANLTLHFENGSFIDFVTWGMDSQKLGGVPRHIIFFDEEPPQNIFNESTMRLLDFRGRWVIAATPVRGMGWTYDLLWEPALEDPEFPVDGFTLSASKNPYLKATKEDLNFYTIGMSEEERRIREEGEFVAKSGLIFPNFHTNMHKYVTEPMVPPKSWAWYMSIDSGWNNPTAILWHAVSPRGRVITFAEHYQDHMTIAEHAEIIKMREREWGVQDILRTGDPAMKQTKENTGVSLIQEYAKHGIYIGVEGVPRDVMPGIEKMQDYMRCDLSEEDSYPAWQISSNCVNLVKELKKYRWASYESEKKAYDANKKEEPHKKDDHACDSARYFFTFMPELRPQHVLGKPVKSEQTVTIDYMDMLVKMSNDPNVTMLEDKAHDEWEIEESLEDLFGGY